MPRGVGKVVCTGKERAGIFSHDSVGEKRTQSLRVKEGLLMRESPKTGRKREKKKDIQVLTSKTTADPDGFQKRGLGSGANKGLTQGYTRRNGYRTNYLKKVMTSSADIVHTGTRLEETS